MNSRTGFNPVQNIYDGYVQDAEGKQWGWIKSLNLYEQPETGLRKDPAQFQMMNIDILGYGSNDGDGNNAAAAVAAVDYDTNADGIFENTFANKALNTQTLFQIVTNSTAYTVTSVAETPELVAELSNTTTINLSEGGGGIYSTINPAPPFIALYISAPSGVAGWYIAEYSGSLGNYNYVRSAKGTSFPDPITTVVTSPLAITFYAEDPGLVGGWSNYTPAP